jgi:hypothetical protein
MLTQMQTAYGRFTEAERKTATSKMETPWDGNPVESIVQQINDAADELALGGTAFSNNQKRDKLYDLIAASNLLPEACQKYRMLPTADKTWVRAQELFSNYATDRDETLTAGGAGYNANHIEQALAATTDVMSPIATAVV